MNWTWYYAAEYCEKEYGSHVDWEEGFFECPECGEPVYREDWGDHCDWIVCPVCEFTFTEEK